MKFIQISDPKDPLLPQLRSLYEIAFPLHERRTWDDLIKLLPEPAMRLMAVVQDEQFIGFMIYWRLDEYTYLEHLAIESQHRRKQFGQRVMDHIIQLSEKRLILETELPVSEDAINRIRFYKRLGLQELPYHYEQPAYRKDGFPFPLQIMSTINLEPEQFERLVGLIKHEIYERFY